MLENETSAIERGSAVLGEYLGGGIASECEDLFSVRADGDGLSRAIELALNDAQFKPSDIGMIVAHGDGTRTSDASEATALLQVFGSGMPPVTGFKWAIGHLFAAAGLLEVTVGLNACRRKVVPSIANLEQKAAACTGLNVSEQARFTQRYCAGVVSRICGRQCRRVVTCDKLVRLFQQTRCNHLLDVLPPKPC